MAATKWTKSAWSSIVKKYPKLEGKSEGVAFCAWGIDSGIDGLPEIRALAKQTGTKLKFSGASIGGARVAMGRAKKKASSPRAQGAKKRGLGTDVGEVIATLLEDLGAEIEDASLEYESGKARLSAAKANFKKLRPVFQQYHAARSRKLAKLLDSTR